MRGAARAALLDAMTDISDILSPIHRELGEVDAMISARLQSELEIVVDLGNHIIGGGKRLRPAMAVLSALACGYRGRDHIKLAVVVELIHTATLLHDDVIDHATKRRGKWTASRIWGNHASVLTGDFLYSRAFQILCEIDHRELTAVMSQTTNITAEGEVQQMINIGRDGVNEEECLQIAEKKTARLFEAACRMAAMLANAGAELQDDLALLGLNFGVAFQLMDDLLDYATGTGKPQAQDLAGGIPTLPFVHAMQNCSDADRKKLGEMLGSEKIREVRALLEAAGSFEYVRAKSRTYAAAAGAKLQRLPPSPYKELLKDLLRFVTERGH